jgi:hypothetical protein
LDLDQAVDLKALGEHSLRFLPLQFNIR